MAFIDGENLVARFQAMLSHRAPQDGVDHTHGEFVWNPKIHLPGRFEVLRAYYYASVVGDDRKVANLTHHIKGVRFSANEETAHATLLYARVYKKPSKSPKTSTVDIQLTVDLLSQVHQRNVDAVLLVTGDGDFAPLAEEVVARGVRLFIGALSDGLSPRLTTMPDQFLDLDPWLLRSEPAG